MNRNATIYIAGHTGMVGSSILRALQKRNYPNLLTQTRSELNLCDQNAVTLFMEKYRPDVVIIAAAKVGGIFANSTYPAAFIYENLAIALHLIHAAYRSGVKRLFFLGSSCIYPQKSPQPIKEEALLTGLLEPTNEPYAIAKIAGVKLCQYYRKHYKVLFHCGMPTNLYGPGDNYHPENSHVVAALLRKFHEAKEHNFPKVTIWGTGKAKREFLYVEDLAEATLHLLQLKNPPDWINIGTGKDLSILDLAKLIQEIVGYTGQIVTDPSRPEGTSEKCLNITKIRATGWEPCTSLKEGLKKTYEHYKKNSETLRVC